MDSLLCPMCGASLDEVWIAGDVHVLHTGRIIVYGDRIRVTRGTPEYDVVELEVQCTSCGYDLHINPGWQDAPGWIRDQIDR